MASAAVLTALVVALLAATEISFGSGGEAQILAPGVLGASATTTGAARCQAPHESSCNATSSRSSFAVRPEVFFHRR
jgi:hypothetical protein